MSRRKSSLASVQRTGLTGEDLEITSVRIEDGEYTEYVDSEEEDTPLPMSPLTEGEDDHDDQEQEQEQELNYNDEGEEDDEDDTGLEIDEENNGNDGEVEEQRQNEEEESELPHAPFTRNYTCGRGSCDFHTQNPRSHLYHLRDAHGHTGKIYECKYCVYASNHSQKVSRHVTKCHQDQGPPVLKPAIEVPINKSAVLKPVVKPEPFHFLKNLLLKEKQEKAAASATTVRNVAEDSNEDEEEPKENNKGKVDGLNENSSSSSSSGSDSGSGSSSSSDSSDSSASDQEEGENEAKGKTEVTENENNENGEQIGEGDEEEEGEEDEGQETEEKQNETGNNSKGTKSCEKESANSMRCTICNYSTKIRSRFTKHVRYHSMPLIKCTYCDFKTPYKWNLDRHYKSHNGEGNLTCPLCNFSADIRQSITVHIQNHHENLTPMRVLELVQSLEKGQSHGLSHTQGQTIQNFSARIPGQVRKGLTVQKIGATTAASVSASASVPIKKPGKAFPAHPATTLCPNIVYSYGDGQGGGPEEINCEYCSEIFGSLEELQMHQNSCEGLAKIQEWNGGLLWNGNEEENENDEELSLATAAAPAKRIVNQNGPVSMRKKVYKCPHANCVFWAVTASRFHVHMVGHNNSKPFECSLCRYKSNWRWDIAKHIKLKSSRDPGHLTAKVVLMDESGERNYKDYDQYLIFMNVKINSADSKLPDCSTKANKMSDIETEINGIDQESELSPGDSDAGIRPRQHNFLKPTSTAPRFLNNSNSSGNNSFLADAAPPASKRLKTEQEPTGTRPIIWKCKKCSFRHTTKEAIFVHLRQSHGVTGKSVPKIQTPALPVSVLKKYPDNAKIQVMKKETPQYAMNKDGSFSCKFCPFKTLRMDSMIVHSEHHFSKANCNYSCDYCSYNCETQNALNEHILLHGNGYTNGTDISVPDLKPMGISRSIKNTSSPSTSSSATISQSNHKKYPCPDCPYVTDSRGQFHYHSQFHLDRDSLYKCNECSYNVSHKHLLHQHVRVHQSASESKSHSDSSLSIGDLLDQFIICDLCPSRFIRISYLKLHSKYHKQQRPIRCPHCSYSVRIIPHLNAHMRVHTAEYQENTKIYMAQLAGNFKVEQEQASPSTSTSRQSPIPSPAAAPSRIRFQEGDDEACEGNPDFIYPTHVKNGKVKEKRYKCKKCPSAFEKRDQYKTHIGLHGSKQRYQCTVCDYAVTFYANFIQHLKKHRTQADVPPELLEVSPMSKRYRLQTTLGAGFNFSCEFCEFVTKQKHLFEDHMSVMHPGEKSQQELMDYEDEEEEDSEISFGEGNEIDRDPYAEIFEPEEEEEENDDGQDNQEQDLGLGPFEGDEDQDEIMEGQGQVEYEDGNSELIEDEDEDEEGEETGEIENEEDVED